MTTHCYEDISEWIAGFGIVSAEFKGLRDMSNIETVVIVGAGQAGVRAPI